MTDLRVDETAMSTSATIDEVDENRSMRRAVSNLNLNDGNNES
jgi:hypothetical protein